MRLRPEGNTQALAVLLVGRIVRDNFSCKVRVNPSELNQIFVNSRLTSPSSQMMLLCAQCQRWLIIKRYHGPAVRDPQLREQFTFLALGRGSDSELEHHFAKMRSRSLYHPVNNF